METVCCVIVEKRNVKKVKTRLEEGRLLHKAYRITELDDISHMAIPVCFKDCLDENEGYLNEKLSSLEGCTKICFMEETDLRCSKTVSPRDALVEFCRANLETSDDCSRLEAEEIVREIPNKWEIHGNLILLPRDSLRHRFWMSRDQTFWQGVADIFRVKRVALIARIKDDDFRTPSVELVLGVDGWVVHIDNNVTYTYDVTKCMFSKGNIGEKMRVSRMNCVDEVVVDLFAGIGYFTIPYLVKTGIKMLYACEWNPDAVDALQKNLDMNHVAKSRYQILKGDNRKVAPKNVADRVNLGLVPTSSGSWQTACEALKVTTGGWLHIHENIDSGANQVGECTCSVRDTCLVQHCYKGAVSHQKRMVWCAFIKRMLITLQTYLPPTSSSWSVNLRHIEYVKSYAPYVDHVVLDVVCRPSSLTEKQTI